jgi:hypothetical protein
VVPPARDIQAEPAVGYCGAGAGAGAAAGSLAGAAAAGLSGDAGTVMASSACSAGGKFCRHSRNTKNRLTVAIGTRIHGHADPFFSGSLIVLPTSNRLAIYVYLRQLAT